jgi:hypothetical protein
MNNIPGTRRSYSSRTAYHNDNKLLPKHESKIGVLNGWKPKLIIGQSNWMEIKVD